MATTRQFPTGNDPVTVIGLGAMGTAIAAALLGRGHPVTVWNRTRHRADALAEAGANVAASAAQAVSASPLVILCLLDDDAVTEVLGTAGDVSGRTLANLTSQTPDQARAHDRWAAARGASYLGGGMMADPEHIGTETATLYYSGATATFEHHRSTLESLGGGSRYFGADPGLAPLYHAAVTGLGFELWVGYLHTAAVFRAESIDAAEFTPLLVDVAAQMVELFPMLAKAIDAANYPPDIGPLRVQAALMGDLIDVRERRGIDAERLRYVTALMQRRLDAGHGDQGFSSLFEEVVPTATPATEQHVG